MSTYQLPSLDPAVHALKVHFGQQRPLGQLQVEALPLAAQQCQGQLLGGLGEVEQGQLHAAQ